MDITPLAHIIREGLYFPRICNLPGSSAALFLALYREPFVALEPTEERAEDLCRDINFFRGMLQRAHVILLPEPDGPSLAGERAKAVFSLGENDSLVSSVRNFSSALWSSQGIHENAITLRKGQEIHREDIEHRLREIGYASAPLVSEKGEYSRRGWLLDIYSSTGEYPVRIEFFGDCIESIRSFDIATQRSADDISEVLIFPAKEPASGIPLSGLMKGTKHFISDAVQEQDRFPSDAVFFSRFSVKGSGYDSGAIPIRGHGIMHEERKSLEDFSFGIAKLQRENRIAIIASSTGQADRLKDTLSAGGITAPLIDREDIISYRGKVSVTLGSLSEGLFFPGFMILTEKEIFGGRPRHRSLRKSKVSKLLTSLDDLRPGDFVVHKDHGIGRFHGLLQQATEGVTEELMLIEYEGGRLYLPLQGINRIAKYHTEEGIVPKVDRLGGKTWHKTKERARKRIHDMAEKLISLYAERELHKGFCFSRDTELHGEFDSFFPYEATPDQLNAIEDIKKDMESEKPMDRLICGDVGYGKTEVAMRAAFKAVYDGRQVAVLVPTTILCEQHYRTFMTRFSAFPVTIDYLSRFKSAREQKKTLSAVSQGNIDIIIGTHALLGGRVRFYNLGLLVIDEEHRFGVRQKEKIKELRKGIDIITLTATPIPRTLHMALSSIRDMSVIETPPEERLAVKSTVSVFDEALIRDCIAKEMERHGQVFFVHNRIKDIYKLAGYVAKLLPAVRMAVAHGQMSERELEKVMHAFYAQETDVLVSTAIIGSGLDIPSANTILVSRADMLGLADLYQLRGRVGRGNIRAFAYFLIPGEDIVTEEAKKRLQAIQEMSYLGAGFRLALKDLEIRGAGNLLGAEQSGHIHALGFDLYMEMLENAVAELKGLPVEEEFDTSIRLAVEAYIPESYTEDITLRLSLYRRIGSARSEEEIISIGEEMQDRFGPVPEEVRNLLFVMKLKILARELRVTRIQDNLGRIRILFSPDTGIEPKDIFMLREKTQARMRFLPDGFEIDAQNLSWTETYDAISGLLKELLTAPSLLV